LQAYQHGFIKKEVNLFFAATEKLKKREPFCLVRIPGQEVELFDSFHQTPLEGAKQFVCKPWRANTTPSYYAKGDNEMQAEDCQRKPHETSYDEYKNSFDLCMTELESNRLQKVVLSRVFCTESSSPPSLIAIFQRAASKYPDALVYLLLHPDEGIWIGASPEILLKKRKSSLETVSLAGTQQAYEGNYEWGDKEKAEQAYVSDHIRSALRNLNCTIQEELGPDTIEAGKVAHLKTRFLFSSETKITELLEHLHPTPAIAGVPTDKAIQQIEKTERHERGLYTGYLGVYDSEKADIYVNLRCMQIVAKSFYLYLGGGITKDSELDKEWLETEYKAKTLLNLLNE